MASRPLSCGVGSAPSERSLPGLQTPSPARTVEIRRCLVVGSPIRHSRSPLIHRLFAEQVGLALCYERREVLPGTLAAALAGFREDGILGINVTVPLKEEAWQLAAQREPRCERAGAANTLWFTPTGEVAADNTDGLGLVRDLLAQGVELKGKRVLVLGAGGATRGIVPSLQAESPAELVVANRTLEKAERLAQQFGVRAAPLTGPFDAPFDLVLNSTSAGLGGGEGPPVSVSALHSGSYCYDLIYAREPTPFMHWAASHGVRAASDGLGMLVEQAAAAFERWHGLRPETRSVLAFLRQGR